MIDFDFDEEKELRIREMLEDLAEKKIPKSIQYLKLNFTWNTF
jgi:hypothetical protein